MYVYDMWEEILSHCDAITRVNLILSNKYLYDSFRDELERCKYTTIVLESKSPRELNYLKDVNLWKKIYNKVGVNKVYMKCSKGGIVKKIWVNLSQRDVCSFLVFLKGGVNSTRSSFPDIESRMGIEELGRGYIQHHSNGKLISMEWRDDLDDRVVFISMNKTKCWVRNVARIIEEKLCIDNENFDLDVYCSIKSRRTKRISINKKKSSCNKISGNIKCGLSS